MGDDPPFGKQQAEIYEAIDKASRAPDPSILAEIKIKTAKQTGQMGGRPPAAPWHKRALERERAVRANHPKRSQNEIEGFILQQKTWGKEPPKKPSRARLKLFLRQSKN